jgi:transposase
MTKKQSTHPEWATRFRKPGTELRLIRNRYYLYEYKTVYDPSLGRPRKITGSILGSITKEDGFKESAKRIVERKGSAEQYRSVLVKEYGNCALIEHRLRLYRQKLEKYFPQDWGAILAVAYCRFVYRCALKHIPTKLASSYMGEIFDIGKFNEKTASALLNKIGHSKDLVHQYQKSFIKAGDYILMDGTNILSKSEHIELVRPGYNNGFNFDGQVNLMYVYSATQHMPVYYRLLAGNIRDVKAFKNTIMMAGLKKVIIIADKGFYSNKNIELLLQEKLSFIIPLKRDNKALIDYEELSTNRFKDNNSFFMYNKRIVWYRTTNHGKLNVHLYLDDSLKLKEETDFLTRIHTHPEEYSTESYKEKRNRLGTIAIITDTKLDNAQHAYETYKSRLYIETLFDSMKNVLEADHTYMQNQQTLEGWMFINHICLQWYQELYIELKNKNLLKKLSVDDCIQTLTDVKKIKINNDWTINEYTNATQKILNALEIKI